MADATAQMAATLANLQRSIDTLSNNVYTLGIAKRQALTENTGSQTKASADPFRDTFKLQAETLRLNKTLTDANKINKLLFQSGQVSQKQNRDVHLRTQLAASYFQKAVESLSTDQLDKLPGKFEKIFKGAYGPIKDYSDVLRLQARAQKANLDKAEFLWQKAQSGGIAIEKLTEELHKLGYTTADFANYSRDASGTIKKLDTEALELSKGFATVGRAEARTSTSAVNLAKGLEFLGGVAVIAYEYLRQAAVAASEFGTAMTPLTATFLGMQPQQLAQLQAANRQALNQSNISIDTFDDRLRETAWSLKDFTGTLDKGAEVYAQSFANAHTLSSNTNQQNKFIEQQISAFKTFHNAYSMTADQFNQLNTTLLANNDVQTQLFKISESQRTSYFRGLQASFAAFKDLGLMDEAAQRATETLAAIGAQNPKERIKEAARLQAVGGALGFGSQARELAALIRSGLRGEGDKTRAAQLEAQINAAVSQRMQGGLNAELVTSALIEPLDKLLGPQSAFGALATSGGRRVTQEQALTSKAAPNVGTIQDILVTANAIETMLGTFGTGILKSLGSITGLVTSILALMGGKTLLGGAAPGLGRGLLPSLAAAGGGGLGGFATALGAAGVAGAAGYGVGTLIDMAPRMFGKQDFSSQIGAKLSGTNDYDPNSLKTKTDLLTALIEDEKKATSKEQDDRLQKAIESLTQSIQQMGGLTDPNDPLVKGLKDIHGAVKQTGQANVTLTQEQIKLQKEQNDKKRVVETRLSQAA